MLEQESVKRAVARAEHLSGGRIVVRPSGTEPVLRILAECEDESAANDAVGMIERAVISAEEVL